MAKVETERSHLKGESKEESDSSPFPTDIRNACKLSVMLKRTEAFYTI